MDIAFEDLLEVSSRLSIVIIALHRVGLDLFFARSSWIWPSQFRKGLKLSELIKVVLKGFFFISCFWICRSHRSLHIGFGVAEFLRKVLDSFCGNFTLGHFRIVPFGMSVRACKTV